ncbi:cyclic GMP-AMP synthase [Scomber scombrus]|uniref:Cyclic GMP-AMP synthase n=1 Tax=Scomber scombrus TaxID=13677 RepID=A0AAV1NN59_SCOSC
MAGRGKPRKAKSLDTECVKSPTRAEETRCSGRSFTEEKHNGTMKEQKPKKRQQKNPTHNEEKQSVQSIQIEKPTKYFPEEEIGKPQKTCKDITRTSVRGTKAKSCAGRAKSPEQFAEETMKTQPEIPKDKTKASPKTKTAKPRNGKAKSPEPIAEETMKTQPEIPKDTTKASPKTKTAKPHNGKAKLLEQMVEEIKMTQPETCIKYSVQFIEAKTCAGTIKSPEEVMKKRQKSFESITKACEPQDKVGVDSILYTTLEKLRIRRNDRSDASKVINDIIKSIVEHLKKNSQSFQEVQEPLRTGSYYENLKISSPDEFDVMLPMPVTRVDIQPFGDDGAFYSVALKRGKSPLHKFQDETGILSASEMLKEFREEVTKCVKPCKKWVLTRKKKGCPAVTLTTEVNSVTISLDFVLCLVVKSSWPPFTKDGLKIEGWLGTKVRQKYKYLPYYLVPKYEGKGTVECDGVLAKDIWRVSFSHVEKDILKNHGSEKTCCEEAGVRCCRKDCLKLLKHLLSLLKERESFDKFCSYHAKTTLLHACCSRTKDTDWQALNLGHCFQIFLKEFEGHLQKGVLHNFFIPTQNLLSGVREEKCRSLAQCIRNERYNGFPIFK